MLRSKGGDFPTARDLVAQEEDYLHVRARNDEPTSCGLQVHTPVRVVRAPSDEVDCNFCRQAHGLPLLNRPARPLIDPDPEGARRVAKAESSVDFVP